MNINLRKLLAWSSALSFLIAMVASGDLVYHNSSVRSNPERFPVFKYEFGEEILLAGNGTWVLTNFQFEYFAHGPDFENGLATIALRLYKNDGLNGTPGTKVYDSGFKTCDPTPEAGAVLEYHDLVVPIPKNFTWTIEFQGIGPASSAGLQTSGLDLYTAPTIGLTYDDYWQRSGPGNTFVLLGPPPGDTLGINFGCRAYATYVGPATITVQPKDIAVVLGGKAKFEVTAIGTPPLSYQWFKSGNPIEGATADTLIINNVSASDAAAYYVRVSNLAGTDFSSKVQLAVIAAFPSLHIEKIEKGSDKGGLVVSWPAVFGDPWVLQETTTLNEPYKWVNSPGKPVEKGGIFFYITTASGFQKYFRLFKP